MCISVLLISQGLVFSVALIGLLPLSLSEVANVLLGSSLRILISQVVSMSVLVVRTRF